MRLVFGIGLSILVVIAVALLFRLPTEFPVRDRGLPDLDLKQTKHLDIVALGTSLTVRNNWPAQLATELEDLLDYPVRLVRVAQSGMGSAWGLTALDRVDEACPDLILIEFAVNDADIIDGVSLRKSMAQHDRLLAALADILPDARILLMTTNPVTGLRGLKRPRLAAYYAAYEELARKHDAGLADFYPRWLEYIRQTDWSEDGLHPTDEAAIQIMLPVLHEIVGRSLKEGRAD